VVAAAAIAHAIADATAHRFVELPITSEAVAGAMVPEAPGTAKRAA
jgi:CO/xanthine dehydrogenase Mo-binding subunit